jgi:glycosyltransferase involved in cell wall biosynthesis
MIESAVSPAANISTSTERRLRVLFISHDAYRAGAELFLLNVIRWMNDNGGFEMQIVLARGGELEADFEALAPTWKIIGARMGRRDKIRRFLTRIALRSHGSDRQIFLTEAAARIGREFQPDVIYANTIVVAHVVSKLLPLGAPVITHVHEMGYRIQYELSSEDFSLLDRNTTHYIAVSSAVAEYLQRAKGASGDRLSVIHGFIPEAARNTDMDPTLRAKFRAELGIPQNAVVVGACGLQTLRKGIDFFLAVAREVLNRKARPELRFVWLGGLPSNELYLWVKHDVDRMGLGGHIQVLDTRKDPSPFFAAIDLFFLSSREDSFPLVCLEAASHAKPIVALAGAGGIAEFIRTDGGLITPYLDVTAASEAILRLAGDPDLRRAMGGAAKARVAADHSPEVGAGRIVNILRRVAKKGSP